MLTLEFWPEIVSYRTVTCRSPSMMANGRYC